MDFHTGRDEPPTSPLRPINPDNASTLRITAAAGTWLAGAYSNNPLNTAEDRALPLNKSGLQPEGLHPARGVAASGLRPLCNIPH